MPTDSPSFTEADAAAFARLLDTEVPVFAPDVPLHVEITPAPDPGDPAPPDGDGDGEDGPSTFVAVSVLRGDGQQVSASAVLHEPLEGGEIARAARACTAGVLAQLAGLDTPDAG